MVVVSLRVSDEVNQVLVNAGLSPSQVARDAIEREARALLARQNLEWLKQHSFVPVEPTLKTIRDMREE